MAAVLALRRGGVRVVVANAVVTVVSTVLFTELHAVLAVAGGAGLSALS